jgi:L-alanine-DL-glutamate epimerase-like enolase superfamily enzyme
MTLGSVLHPPDRPQLTARHDVFPLEKSFVIARGAKTEAHVVTVEILEGSKRGRGECVPYARYGETIDSVLAQIEQVAPSIETGMVNRRGLQKALPAGAARNAIDCALWDFDAKRTQTSVWQMAGLDWPKRLTTAYTLSLGSPEAMAAAALEEAHRPLLKLKLGGLTDMECVAAVRAALPKVRLIVDANEGWSVDQLAAYMPQLRDAGVELIEQPVPAAIDEALGHLPHLVPICADESCHVVDDLQSIVGRYDAINIKLDKTGGFSHGLELLETAREMGFKIMVGCMCASSLSIAPAVLLAQSADWVDLDAPLLLARDRQPGLRYDGSVVYPANVGLWG